MDQVLAEMQRRDIAADLREAREDRKRQKWAALRTERRSVVESEFINAEAATNGYMLNRLGVEAGVDPRTSFTGREARARKYASEDLLDCWQDHPPTDRRDV